MMLWQVQRRRFFRTIFFKIFSLGQGWRTVLKVRAQIADNLRKKNYFACGNQNVLATYCQLFQGRLSVRLGLALWAATRLARPLVRLWVGQDCMLLSSSDWMNGKNGLEEGTDFICGDDYDALRE